jgi:di/tricarboxylate transporter
MPIPEPHAIAVMLLTVAALYLFSRESLPIQTSSLLVVALLAIGFTVFPYQTGGRTAGGALDPIGFFAGFGNEALIAICALMMASQGLVRTGALAPIGRLVTRSWLISPLLAMGVMLLITAVVSAFMNNTPQVVLMIPILASVAMRAGTSPSKLLMPMTFASQVGGMATPIGTSLNLLVIGSAAGLGVPRFHMFDFFAPVALAAIPALLFLWFVAPRLLPAREHTFADSPRIFEGQLRLTEDSAVVGKTIADAKKLAGAELVVQSLLRPPGLSIAPLPDVTLRTGDQLVVRDTSERLMEYARALDATLFSGDTLVDAEHPLASGDQHTAQLVLTPTSPLRDRTLERANFDWHYQLIPLAIHRPGDSAALAQSRQLRDVQLGVGDVLLVQGPAEQIDALKQRNDLLVLDATSSVPLTAKAPLALAIMAGIVLTATLRIAPVAIAAVCGVLLMTMTGCLRWRDAVRALDSSMILLTVASLALSLALVTTGGAAFLARLLVAASGSLPPAAMLSATILLMAALSNVISNSAAAVIGTPIAVELARQLGLPPEPFVLAAMFGVNMGFATPMADNCNLLVYSAGGYAFRDFMRAGIPLTIIMWLAFSWILPQFYPLH